MLTEPTLQRARIPVNGTLVVMAPDGHTANIARIIAASIATAIADIHARVRRDRA